jgi:hypothetical protein
MIFLQKKKKADKISNGFHDIQFFLINSLTRRSVPSVCAEVLTNNSFNAYLHRQLTRKLESLVNKPT